MRSSLAQLSGKTILLVASTGGHLTQLTRLAPRLGVDAASPWLTFDSAQSRSLLVGQNVLFVPYVSPRDVRGIMRASALAFSASRDVEGALSTGAGLALAVLPQMALTTRKPVVFIESISRVNGPSLSGRILQRTPRVGLYAQHSGWCRGPWQPGPSVLSDYSVVSCEPAVPHRILVTLGSIGPYRFDRLVEIALSYVRAHPSIDVTWQLGATSRADLPGRVEKLISDADFAREIQRSDLIVAHAGVGVAMNILDQGKIPVLLPRRAELGEHVDGHQLQIHDYLVKRGLALNAETALTTPAGLNAALGSRVVKNAVPLTR